MKNYLEYGIGAGVGILIFLTYNGVHEQPAGHMSFQAIMAVNVVWVLVLTKLAVRKQLKAN